MKRLKEATSAGGCLAPPCAQLNRLGHLVLYICMCSCESYLGSGDGTTWSCDVHILTLFHMISSILMRRNMFVDEDPRSMQIRWLFTPLLRERVRRARAAAGRVKFAGRVLIPASRPLRCPPP